MNCLNKEEYQKYIDKEVSAEEMALFNEHISGCPVCQKVYNTTQDELFNLMNLLSKVELNESEIVIPEFRKSKKANLRLLKYISVAASVLILTGTTWLYQNEAQKKQAVINASLEMEQLLYHSDSNKSWNKKEPLVTITNKEGEIIYSTFDD